MSSRRNAVLKPHGIFKVLFVKYGMSTSDGVSWRDRWCDNCVATPSSHGVVDQTIQFEDRLTAGFDRGERCTSHCGSVVFQTRSL